MPRKMAASGYTNVVLVLNMKRFVPDEADDRFEALRGTDAFARLIKEGWGRALEAHPYFEPLTDWKKHQLGTDWHPKVDAMSTENVGLATGVFRSVMLQRFVTPTYALDKSKITFERDLETNFQFRNLFRRVFDRWDIYIRPTMTGFFTVRLTYRYQGRDLLDLARDVHRLQEPFDIPSAINWYRQNKERYRDNPEKLTEKQRSIEHLLRWLGADLNDPQPADVLYYPVQWKLALEVVNWLVDGASLPLGPEPDAPRLRPAPRSLSIPLHDSYVIYHFDDLLAHPALLRRGGRGQGEHKVQITLNDLRQSPALRNRLAAFLEGTILRPDEETEDPAARESAEAFPKPRWKYADQLLEQNLASWNDELCLLTCRTALFMPAGRWKDHQLAVTTMPGSTLQVRYARYWGALERMVEFILETRVLAQLIESESYRLLEEMARTVERVRGQMIYGDIQIDEPLLQDMIQAAHLHRLAALAQSMGHPQFWSRAEYAVAKAQALLQALDVPQIFAHVHQNIESINNVAEHVDDLYVADLAEQDAQKMTLLSAGLTALSFLLTLLALPSFWADLESVRAQYAALDGYLYGYYWGGTIFGGLAVSAAGVFLLVLIIKRWGDWGKAFRALFQGRRKVNHAD